MNAFKDQVEPKVEGQRAVEEHLRRTEEKGFTASSELLPQLTDKYGMYEAK